MTTKDSREFGALDVLGLIAFAVSVAGFMLVSAKAGMRVVGLWMIVGAILHHCFGKGVPYGWEGQPPRSYLTGWPAHLFHGTMVVVGCAMVVWPEVALGIAGWEDK